VALRKKLWKRPTLVQLREKLPKELEAEAVLAVKDPAAVRRIRKRILQTGSGNEHSVVAGD